MFGNYSLIDDQSLKVLIHVFSVCIWSSFLVPVKRSQLFIIFKVYTNRAPIYYYILYYYILVYNVIVSKAFKYGGCLHFICILFHSVSTAVCLPRLSSLYLMFPNDPRSSKVVSNLNI